MPPCFLISGESDPMLHHTEIFMDSLCEVDVEHECCIFPAGNDLGHAFPVFNPDLRESRNAIRYIAEFFNRYRKGDVSE
jgi:acetyl esterase/lipase